MVNKFNKKVKELRISENLKELVPSKCKVGQRYQTFITIFVEKIKY